MLPWSTGGWGIHTKQTFLEIMELQNSRKTASFRWQAANTTKYIFTSGLDGDPF